MGAPRTFALILAAVAALASPLFAQTEPGLGKELPWFVEKAQPPTFPEILVASDWMIGRLESPDVVAVDLRPLSDYEAGHLPGAVHLDVPREPAASEDTRALLRKAGLSGNETLVLYGGERDRSAIGQAFLGLSGIGLERVKVLTVGFETWVRSSLPVEKDRPVRQPPPLAPELARSSIFISREDLLASFGRSGYEVLDLRGGWGSGYATPPRFAAGHVPSALPFDIHTLLPATGWPDPVPARDLLMALGPRASEHVDPNAVFLLYGAGPSDPDLGLGFLLLRTLGVDVRVFAPGFPAWAENPQDPIVRVVDAEEVRGLLAREQHANQAGTVLKDELPKSFILLDLREDWDYDDDHIPGALSLPEHLFDERFESVLHEHWPKVDPAVTPLVLYCYGRECTRSRNCARSAAQKGFRKLLWLREGMAGWEAISQRPAAR